MNIVQKPTKHYTVGRAGQKPEVIVIHIMDGSLVGTDNWFASPESQVSAHYGIGQQGEVHQYVKEKDTAYHAGVVSNPTFKLYKAGVSPNLYTIGIEHEGVSVSVWSAAMKKASAELIKALCERWGIPIDRDHIIGHYQVRSTKPNCPAQDKRIIDELILLAGASSDSLIGEVKKKIEDAQMSLNEAMRLLS